MTIVPELAEQIVIRVDKELGEYIQIVSENPPIPMWQPPMALAREQPAPAVH
jgi:hypothetical protein